MDRSKVQRRLEEAESCAKRGEQSIADQRAMIQTLERGGHDARAENLFLRWLLNVQGRYLQERDRLLEELRESGTKPYN
jgi:hypothetical protein